MKRTIKLFKYAIILVLFIVASVSCGQRIKKENQYDLEIVSDIQDYKKLISENPANTFIDLEEVIPGIVLDIRYATKNNFTKEIIYESPKAYVRKPVAEALVRIQDDLKSKGLALKIFDAYRPYAATVKFYEVYPDTTFVAAPWKGSVHNRGCAVDVSIIDLETMEELEMPTLFDDFTEKAGHDYMDLPEQVLKNRQLLKDIMTKHGFTIYKHEWWHYNFKAWENYDLTDILFKELN